MKKVEIIVRMVLGIVLVVFGLDKFLAFVPHGHVMTEELMSAYQGLLANKFILPTVGIVELVTGIILISGRYIIVVLTALTPVIFGILAFHFAVDLHGILPGLGVAALYVYLMVYRRKAFAELIRLTKSL
ncbi:MAG: hypothetical protein CL840_01720 [Crocinitomicaceae bacterium]|nr:hypothetical protein [Crocinitomicaceae bacterium]|tara:strand:- start:2210 stop:2599 length:390 start_codon:yes stop_codon:yes gene_type:complete